MKWAWIFAAVVVILAQQAHSQCRDGGKDYENGDKWINRQCNKKLRCVKGNVKDTPYNCPNDSSCRNGECRCNDGFEEKSKDSDGLLKKCKEQVDESCRSENKKYENGDKWINRQCNQKFRCQKGNVKEAGAFNCPKDSTCRNGECRCNDGFKVKSKDSDGILKKCEPKSEECRYENKNYGNNVKWLNRQCNKKLRCNKGEVKESGHSCPNDSSCQNGECRCNNGFEEKSRDGDNFLKKCKAASQKCRYENKNYADGARWINGKCDKKVRCNKGAAQESNFQCPADSSCKNGQCKCNNGFEEKSRDNDGILKKCKQTSDDCLERGKKYLNGAKWLNQQCDKKLRCNKGNVKNEQFGCPKFSSCRNGDCRCNANFEEKSRDNDGILKKCEKIKDCTLGGKLYKQNSRWLNDNCDKKMQCKDGDVKEDKFSCPQFSSCKRGKCHCNNGYEEKSRDSNAILRRCKVTEKAKCGNGYKRFGAKCLSVRQNRRVNFWDARDQCKKAGGRLHTARDSFALFNELQKFKAFRGRKFFINGDRSLAAKNLEDIKNTNGKKLVASLVQRFKIPEGSRVSILKRFTGNAKSQDWTLKSSVSAFCMGMDDDGPTALRCMDKAGYICEKVEKDDEDVFWSKWYDVEKTNDKGSQESLHKILKELNNKFTGKADRICKKPLEMQCRQKGTNTLFSKGNTNGLKLNQACEKNKIRCYNRQQSDGKKCVNFEVRFKCPDDQEDCSMAQVRRACEQKGKTCVDRRTGPVCIKQRRKREKTSQLGESSCFLDSKEYKLYQCKATGDPHYTTFDGRSYDFHGTCTYDFVSTCKNFQVSDRFPAFKIAVKNYKAKQGAIPSWTKGFSLTIGDQEHKYVFKANHFSINGDELNAVGFSDENIKISGKTQGKLLHLIIQTTFCMRIEWDNRYGLRVYVPDTYKNHVCGLCGDFDGVQTNDMKDPDTNQKMTQSFINQNFMTAGPFEQEGEICPIKIVEPPVCSATKQQRLGQPDRCGIFNVNGNSPLVKAIVEGSEGEAKTNNRKSLEEEFTECVNDLCWEPETDRCRSIEDVVDSMNRDLNFMTDDLDKSWRSFAQCGEPKCGENMEFSRRFKVNCQSSCANPEADVNCDDDLEEAGCVCNEGFVFNAEMKCVPADECVKTCNVETENGVKFSLDEGQEYVEVPCEIIKVCKEGELEEKKMGPCSIHASCKRNGKKCVCNEGYKGNGVECKTDLSCRKGYKAVGEKCYKFVNKLMNWHSAAINCGRDGSGLARYDEVANEELATFFQEIPRMMAKKSAHKRRVFCRKNAPCKLPRHYEGVEISLPKGNKGQRKDCGANDFRLAADKKSVQVLNDKCKGWFSVIVIKSANVKRAINLDSYISGNTYVVKQNQREGKDKFQIDPPQMLDMGSFKDPHGCFRAYINKDDKMIVSPTPRCHTKKTSICEYDNTGAIPHNPLDFKRLKEKVNFQEADDLCKLIGRPLAAVVSDEQSRFVNKLIKQSRGDVWIGAQYNSNRDKFVWTNNKAVTFTNYRGREPNNYNENKRSNEKCIAVQKNNGRWYSEDCEEKNYPLCGPPFNMEPASYTKYYRVKKVKDVNELKQRLTRQGKNDFICSKPISVECGAKDKDDAWLTSLDREARQKLTCRPNKFECKAKRGLNCDSFRVRFLCPQEENQCEVLKNEGINPCSGGRTCIPVRNHYMCRCPQGKSWNPKKQTCHSPCGVCHASGDPHYTTFDGNRYDFMGTCMYKFAGNCDLKEFENSPTFDVYTLNKPCGRNGAACIYSIEVHLRKIPYNKNGGEAVGNFVFKVSRENNLKYEYNGNVMEPGEFKIDGAFHVVRKNNYFSLISEALDLSVLFSGTKLTVNNPEQFVHKMCGLCGNCGTSKLLMNDMSEVEIPKKNNGKYDNSKVIPFANNWIVPHPGTDPEKCKVVEILDECSAEMKTKLQDKGMCGIFNDQDSEISKCFETIDPAPYFKDCTLDGCHADMMESVCTSVKIYAQDCMKQGIILDWRKASFCPMDCKEKMYKADASCEPMCGRDMNADTLCDEEPEEGCVCPSGFMKQGDECVPEEKCGCEVMNGEQTILIRPGKSKLLSRCEEIAKCVINEDGSSEEVREEVTLDPNAICVEDPEPKIDCARGYILQDDARTCEKDPNGCSEGFKDRAGMCIRVPKIKKVWRQAMHACNQKDGTLALINTDVKLAELGKIMKENNYEDVFISGQVRVEVDDDDNVSFKPVLTREQEGKIEYYNFDYSIPPVTSIELSEELDIEELKGEDVILALIASAGEGDEVSIIAVPRGAEANFVCEERYVKPTEEEWVGPCSSDNNMKDGGDQETRISLQKNQKCLLCPKPMDVRCKAVAGSTGTIKGDCENNKQGNYYTCDAGNDCVNMAIETKCARDVDECAEGLDDCPVRSSCKNTIGAYKCRCDKDVPLMIQGECHAKEVCTMQNPSLGEMTYSVAGFSDNLPGAMYYKCPYKLFETCRERYNPESGLPLLSIYTTTVARSGGFIGIMGGWIGNPETGKVKHFAVYSALLKQGKFLYGDDSSSMQEYDLGFGCSTTQTYFSFAPPNILVARHFDNHFRFIITYPMNFGIEVSKEYSEIACGVCTMGAAERNGVMELSGDDREELSAQYVQNDEKLSQCNAGPEPPLPPAPTVLPTSPPPSTPPPPPPPTEILEPELPDESGLFTTPPQETTQPPPPPPTTEPELPDESGIFTTQPPPEPTPVVDPEPPCAQDEETWDFCMDLSSLCNIDLMECVMDLCGRQEESRCLYLATANLKSCETEGMDEFLDNRMCDPLCGDDMVFDFTGGMEPERCEGGEEDESFSGVNLFSCRCDESYKLSGDKCVPAEECGCLYTNGGEERYIKKGESFTDKECNFYAVCEGNNQMSAVGMMCSENSVCVNSDSGYRCQCAEGFFGDANMQGGCQLPEEEDETKVCFPKLNPEGFKQATCKCKMGYASDCESCVDIDECTDKTHDCDADSEMCENVPGTFKCSCATGFEASADGCQDVDECQLGQARCGSNEGCINKPGSYDCNCCAGFTYNIQARECQPDPLSGIRILVSSPKCCMECDDPIRCQMSVRYPSPFCVEKNGKFEEFSNYQAMYLHHCVNNINLPASGVSEGPCPEVEPTFQPPVGSEAPNPTEGGSPTEPAGSGATEGSSGNPTDAPAGSTPQSNAQTPPPPDSCTESDFCQKIPPPPSSLNSGPVCGPANAVEKETYPSYCEMVRAICLQNGGPPSIPPTPVAAESGECPPPTTTTPPPPPSTKPPPTPAPQEEITMAIQDPNPGPTSAPTEEVPKTAPTVVPEEPWEPLLGEWTPWSRCNVENTELPCGRGQQARTRVVVPYEDDRQVLSTQQDDLYDERTCFKPCEPTDPEVTPELCEEPGICEDLDEVCGAIGSNAPETFMSECELNVEACKAGERPTVVKKGACGAEPQEWCNDGPETIIEKYVKNDAGQRCVGEEVAIRSCRNLMCEGGFDNCCVATGYEKVAASYNCMDNTGEITERLPRVYLSATGCKCADSNYLQLEPELVEDDGGK